MAAEGGGLNRPKVAHRSPAALLLIVAGACGGGGEGEQSPDDGGATPAGTLAAAQEVSVYRACDSAVPGSLVPLPRQVARHADPVAASIREVVSGANERERERGCSSFFSSATAEAVRSVRRSGAGDTVAVDFRDFADDLPDRPGVKSFLPPGVMAELTWTVFRQFPEVDAVRFSFDGDERAFWTWLSDRPGDAGPFTREMWERI